MSLKISKARLICRSEPCWCGEHEPYPEPDPEVARKNQEWVEQRKRERGEIE